MPTIDLASKTGGRAESRAGADLLGVAKDKNSADVREVIYNSWKRSAPLVPKEIKSAPADGEDAVIRWHEQPTAQAVSRLERAAAALLEDGNYAVNVTDEVGRVVWSAHYNSKLRRLAETVNLVPGTRWDEASIGTNAGGLALRMRRPAAVLGSEHYIEALAQWSCYAAPIVHPVTGDALGAIALATRSSHGHPLALGVAKSLAEIVAAELSRIDVGSQESIACRFMGRSMVKHNGQQILLPGRQAEILALILLHPEGLSLEQLHAYVYDDGGGSLSTIKSEVSRLRKALGGAISPSPYRMLANIRFDANDLMSALRNGDFAQAVILAQGGEFMPKSSAPAIIEHRNFIEASLREAALKSRDITSLLTYATRSPYELDVLEHLAEVTPPGDARASTIRAMIQRALAD
ncbi:hypothetical protein LVY72_11870 [Arthrobacter sp. I2-34]|uniref:OmpR/PhoB-type domain-containing protein n=1 Tax=Arthrobacter hankyongi TaxID=2904801 RepID=A0ABS9L7W9_9MICC|nr:helix-turn-helix domain-containing protein [Arthrobacter hankyongi]MCG2622608.1 hypothetical protein [Arthrobacter hankyongi]